MHSATAPLPADDLDHIFTRTRGIFEQWKGAWIFLTGGTGFFGRWLLESFLHNVDTLSLDARITVLTRDPDAFAKKAPHVAMHPVVTLLKGDIRSFAMPSEHFSHVIHAATDASVAFNREQPAEMYETIVEGTKRVLSLIAKQGHPRCLLVSSGVVYGTQPSQVTHMPEDEAEVQRPLAEYSAYAQGKRDAEKLWGNTGPIARCYAFVGPHLPLDIHFAIGNFLGDAMSKRAIDVKSDGTPQRSYLYAADLAVWLWTTLEQGENGRTYNVGSEENLSVADVARMVARSVSPEVPVHIAKELRPGSAIERYVPATSRARQELGLRQEIGLSQAIQKTLWWYTQA